MVDRSSWDLLNNFGEVSFSVVFDRPKDYFSELLYTKSHFPCQRHFLASRGQNWPFPSKILLIYITLNEEFDCDISFWQTTYFEPFSGTLRVSEGQKGQKLSIPLKMTPRSWKFAQMYNFWSQISYYHSFRTNYKF